MKLLVMYYSSIHQNTIHFQQKNMRCILLYHMKSCLRYLSVFTNNYAEFVLLLDPPHTVPCRLDCGFLLDIKRSTVPFLELLWHHLQLVSQFQRHNYEAFYNCSNIHPTFYIFTRKDTHESCSIFNLLILRMISSSS